MEAHYSPDDPFCFVATITASNLSRDRLYLPKMFVMSNGLLKKTQIVLMNEEEKSWTIRSKHEVYSGRFYMRGGWSTFCVANGMKPGDLLALKLIRNEEIPVLQFVPMNSEILDKLEPSHDSEHGNCLNATKKEFLGAEATEKEFLGTEATEKEFLGVEVYPNDARQENCSKGSKKEHLPSVEPTNDYIRQGKCTKTIKEEYVSTNRNRFVTLTLRPTSFKIRRLNLPLEFTMENGLNTPGKICKSCAFSPLNTCGCFIKIT